MNHFFYNKVKVKRVVPFIVTTSPAIQQRKHILYLNFLKKSKDGWLEHESSPCWEKLR